MGAGFVNGVPLIYRRGCSFDTNGTLQSMWCIVYTV